VSAHEAARHAWSCWRRAAESGHPADLAAAEAAVEDGLARFDGWPDLWLLRATIDVAVHRVDRVEGDLAAVPGLASSREGRALQADADVQLGRVEEARAAIEALVAERRAWADLARLAAFEDDPERADALLAEAEDDLTAKELRSFAWLELQRAGLWLRAGDLARARRHVERADAAAPGFWRVERAHVALLAAEGRLAEARARAEELFERVPRPELAQTVGDLHARLGEPERADEWHERALAGYLASVDRGEVQYLHHLAEFHLDVREDLREAERWARLDHDLRPNAHTRAILERSSRGVRSSR
jgi:tetratricopeptide (TPR) repeat protein